MKAPPDIEKDALGLFADLLGVPGALLPILQRIQERLGYVPAHFVPIVAQALNLSRAEVHGVLSFYHDLRSEPPGRHSLKICQAEACRSMGAAALTQHATARRVSVEPVYCLGNCACSPAITIDGRLHGRVTPARLDALLAALPE